MIIGGSKSQQEIDTQIDRLGDEFLKQESSDGIHELERGGMSKFRDYGGIWTGGEYMDHHPIPKVVGG